RVRGGGGLQEEVCAPSLSITSQSHHRHLASALVTTLARQYKPTLFPSHSTFSYCSKRGVAFRPQSDNSQSLHITLSPLANSHPIFLQSLRPVRPQRCLPPRDVTSATIPLKVRQHQ